MHQSSHRPGLREQGRLPGYQTPNTLRSWETLQSPGCQSKSVPCPTATAQNGATERKAGTPLAGGTWSRTPDGRAGSAEPSSCATGPSTAEWGAGQWPEALTGTGETQGLPVPRCQHSRTRQQPRSRRQPAQPLVCTALGAGLLPRFRPAVLTHARAAGSARGQQQVLDPARRSLEPRSRSPAALSACRLCSREPRSGQPLITPARTAAQTLCHRLDDFSSFDTTAASHILLCSCS